MTKGELGLGVNLWQPPITSQCTGIALAGDWLEGRYWVKIASVVSITYGGQPQSMCGPNRLRTALRCLSSLSGRFLGSGEVLCPAFGAGEDGSGRST